MSVTDVLVSTPAGARVAPCARTAAAARAAMSATFASSASNGSEPGAGVPNTRSTSSSVPAALGGPAASSRVTRQL
jgi:hypothetical protein